MKVFLTLIFLLVGGGTFYSQVLLKLSNDTLTGYYYSGGDEFNGPVLNENEWTNGLGWTRVLVKQDLAFPPKNVKLKDGLLNFVANKEDSAYVLGPWELDSNYYKKKKIPINNTVQTKYSAGCIISKKKYHYGLYELRFKVEKGKGIWPAFWFYGGYKNEEIDAFELKGEKNNKMHVDTHCPSGCDAGYKTNLGIKTSYGGWLPLSGYLHDGFSVMFLEWKPDEVIWYINGYPLAYFKGSFSNPMKLFLNTSVAKNGESFNPGPDKNTTWPNKYYIDYFRSWQKVKPGSELVLKINNELKLSNQFLSNYGIKPLKKRGFMYKKKKLNKENGMISLTRLSENKLIINVLGKIANSKTQISVKGLRSDEVTLPANSNKEIEIDIDPNETEMELIIATDTKEYRQKIIIHK